jgi:energy-coupling factor transporter transmembrane protein EcfT
MKAKLPQPVHESYKKHRRELAWQIILPMALSVVGFVALIVLIYFATFEGDGDVGRWTAISTIWIVIPVMLAGLILLALIGGLVYLMKRLLNVAPTYTGMAQDYVHIAAGYIKRGTEMAVKPVLFLDGVGASIRTFFGRK